MFCNRYPVILVLCLFCAACGAPQYSSRVLHNPTNQHLKGHQKPYEVNGERYVPLLDHVGFVDEGRASWYGKDFHGKKTSNGETYDMYAMTAAHKTLPLGVFVRVKNLDNGTETVVRVNDRGPFVAGRIIDLSYSAAQQLDVVGPGTAPVRIEALGYQIKEPGGKVSYQQPKSYDSGVFAVQVGAFSVEENARRLADDLGRRYGHSALRRVEADKKIFFRVHVGKYDSLEEAQSALVEFAIDGFEGFVVAVD